MHLLTQSLGSITPMLYPSLGSTGLKVSVLSFGAFSLGGVIHDATEKQCVEPVEAAIAGGINFIDVSPAYGESLAEKNLGLALIAKLQIERPN